MLILFINVALLYKYFYGICDGFISKIIKKKNLYAAYYNQLATSDIILKLKAENTVIRLNV